MTSHAAKRRRIDNTLSKPFRSPMKTAETPRAIPGSTHKLDQAPVRRYHTSQASEDTSGIARNAHSPSTRSAAQGEIPDSEDDASPIDTTFDCTNGAADSQTSNSIGLPSAYSPLPQSAPSSTAASSITYANRDQSIPTNTPATKYDSFQAAGSSRELRAAEAFHKDLGRRQKQQQIAALKQQIDTLSSAPILSSSTTRLPELIDTWMRVAREAAEMLYPGIRERAQAERAENGWSSRGKGQGQNGPLSRGAEDEREEKLEALLAQERDLAEGASDHMGGAERKEALKNVRDAIQALKSAMARQEGEGLEEGQDHEFTMGTMLRGMNIEWDLLGWDYESQDWKD